MKELKEKATKLGLDFKGNISKVELTSMIEAKLNQVASDSKDNDLVIIPNVDNNKGIEKMKEELKVELAEAEHIAPEHTKRIKVVITPRDSEEKEGYVGLNNYTAQYQFGEVIELPEGIVDFIKSKGGKVYQGNGNFKWQSRFLVEYV